MSFRYMPIAKGGIVSYTEIVTNFAERESETFITENITVATHAITEKNGG